MSFSTSKWHKQSTRVFAISSVLFLIMVGVTTSCNNERITTLSAQIESKADIIDKLVNDETFVDYFKASFEGNIKKQAYKEKKYEYSANYATEDYSEFLKKFNNNAVIEESEVQAILDFSYYPEKATYEARKNANFQNLLKKYSQSMADSAIVKKAFTTLNNKLNPLPNSKGSARSAGCYNPECDAVFVAYERMANLDRQVIEFTVKATIAASGIPGIEAAAAYLGVKIGGKAGAVFLEHVYTFIASGSSFDPVATIANMAGDMMYVSTATDGQAQYCACQRKNGCACSYVSPAWWYSRGNNTLLPMPMY